MLRQIKNRNLYIMLMLDSLAFSASLLFAYVTRFSFTLSSAVWWELLAVLPWVIAVKSVTFLLLGAYEGLWRYTSLADARRLLKASALSTLIIIAGLTYFNQFHGYPRSVFLADSIFTCFLCGGLRIAIRLYYKAKRQNVQSANSGTQESRVRLVIVGAGDAADSIIREIQDTASRYEVVCCLDDAADKRGGRLRGVPIRGPIERLPEFVLRYEAAEVLIAIPSLPGSHMLAIFELAKKSGVRCRTLPPLSSIIDGHVSVKDVRDVVIEDLLGREPVRGDHTAVQASLTGSCVMVTGAGGSIGSEIARQVASCRPRRLVLFEIGESPLFEIHRELHDRHPDMEIVPVIGDIRRAEVVNRTFETYAPAIVYHAAAYKHVPLMEAHPDEAVLNNVQGTRHLAEAACRAKTRRFVMISSDKAVRPGNIMGATKRLCELLVEAMNGGATEFVAVRFGNVLGSNGSVIPIFQKQIAAREPITVTDPEMTRFFMTIPEAVHLVLRCSAMPEKHGLYVLEMGTPVRIMDLARNMIRLSGLREGVDIPITITGLRPGEKMHEELITYGEGLRKTDVNRVNTLEQTMLPIAPKVFLAIVRRLEEVATMHDVRATRTMLMRIISLDQDVRENEGHGASDAVLRSIEQSWADVAALGGGDLEHLPKGKRMLLIDDELSMRNTLDVMLSSRVGYEVDVAETKQEALARIGANESSYDVILCDLYLPDGTGMEILAEQRKRGDRASFILMTAYDSPLLEDILGMDAAPPLLFKPFCFQDLLTIVDSESGRQEDVCSSRAYVETASASRALPAADDSATAPLQDGHGMRVLIVDDSALIRERLMEQLNELPGIEIVGQAASLEQAIDAVRRLKPDAMTLDLHLPDGNGMRVLRLIQSEGLSTAVIVFTSYPGTQYEARTRAAGAYAFLNKSADIGKITDHVQALMSGRHLSASQAES